MGRHAQQQTKPMVEVTWPPLIQRLRQRAGAGFWLPVAIVVAFVIVAVTVLISTNQSSTSSASSISDDSLVGTTPLGCEVRRMGNITSTAPWCTQQALAKKLCDLDISGATPTVDDAGSAMVASWRWSDASVTSYRLNTGSSMFTCSNYTVKPARGRTVSFDAQQWSRLNSVGPDTPQLENYFRNGGAF